MFIVTEYVGLMASVHPMNEICTRLKYINTIEQE